MDAGRTYYVDPTGSNGNAGTSDMNRITYKGETGKSVFIKGSDIWSPNWTSDSTNVYYVVPDGQLR